ncbi:MAG: C4-dicarboxylate ABC transporter permease [Rhodospirillaceae bacterium]|nr:C4-dicarboxylate ABC transporter permease [Rhodospirillaceae bacterium]|tara:strand:+ start:117 stop:770 length:654 start_codon:yes stop_codon:yes gene_type:complete
MTEQSSPDGGWADRIEETLIAVFLGLMTLITFANVVARYVFNDNILWALEATVFLFAWMVLLGACYGVKKSLHLGVDIVVAKLSPSGKRLMGICAAAACLLFAVLLLKGGWDYWYPFVTKRAFLETNDVPMPEFLQFIAIWMNEGEKYEKIPRFIPYAVLPLSLALMTWRFGQAGWQIWRGERTLLIASHEAEEMMQEFEEERAGGSEKDRVQRSDC